MIVFLFGMLLAQTGADNTDGLRRLIEAYPQHLVESGKPNVLRWKDGAEMTYDDGIVNISLDEMLSNPCLKDQMSMAYACAWPAQIPKHNHDPGRVRCDAFFQKMYGNSAAEVEKNLTKIPWLPAGAGKEVSFSKVNDAAKVLEVVGRKIAVLSPDIQRYVSKPIGTFVWREVKGEKRPSPHSYGIAIDFELPKNIYKYWRWDHKETENTVSYPQQVLRDTSLKQIVSIFERHGFIWGGKWYHYDTMHFEYRPELALPEK